MEVYIYVQHKAVLQVLHAINDISTSKDYQFYNVSEDFRQQTPHETNNGMV